MNTIKVDVEIESETSRQLFVAILAKAMGVPVPGVVELVTVGTVELYEITDTGVKIVGCPQTAHKHMKNYDAI